MSPNPGDWAGYERLVLDKLKILEHDVSAVREDVKAVREDVVMVRIDIAGLKVKAGVWGGAVGMIPALATAIIVFISGAGPGA